MREARAFGRLGLALTAKMLGLWACSPGAPSPGADGDQRTEGLPDRPSEWAEEDAGPSGADLASGADLPGDDTGFVLRDAGVPGRFSFTGVFSAAGTVDNLYAFELDGRLVVVVGYAPYVYAGRITPEGRVEAESPVLARSGCPGAVLTGAYARSNATFDLYHRTCSDSGAVLESRLRGGLFEAFEPSESGVYQGRIFGARDPTGCSRGLALGRSLRWGLGLLRGGRAMLVTLEDPIEEPFAYLGTVSRGGLALLAPVAAGPFAQAVAFQGSVTPGAAGVPAILSGRRDVFRPPSEPVGAEGAGCAFQVDVDLSRTVDG